MIDSSKMMAIQVNTLLTVKEVVGQRKVTVEIPEGGDVGRLLEAMVRTWGPELEKLLFEPGTRNLFPHMRILINGRLVPQAETLAAGLKPGDEVIVMPPAGGG